MAALELQDEGKFFRFSAAAEGGGMALVITRSWRQQKSMLFSISHGGMRRASAAG